MKYLIVILTVSIFYSCSSSKNAKPYKASKLQDPPAKHFLSREDFLKFKAIEKYRLLRTKRFSNRSRRKKLKKNRYYSRPKIIQSPEAREEMRKAIGQNIDYYCIKKESSGKFNNNKECLQFAKAKLKNCEETSNESFTRRILICLKQKLN